MNVMHFDCTQIHPQLYRKQAHARAMVSAGARD